MACKYGSEPKPNSPPITWISYRDLLSCNGQEGEPWYCNLIVDIPNLLNLKNTNNFCTNPQPVDPGYPTYADVISGQSLAKLTQKAEHMAWGGLCQCKLPPPPSVGFKDFPVLVPAKDECTAEIAFTFYRDYTVSQSNEDRGKSYSGIPSKGVIINSSPNGSKNFTAASGYEKFPEYSEQTDTYNFQVTFFAEDIPGVDLGEYGIAIYLLLITYNPTSLEGSSLRLKSSTESPISFFYNYLNPCDNPPKDPPKDPPPNIPPPPDVCCPPKPVDLTDIYNRLNELQALIEQLPPPPIIGSSSIETSDKPFGVYLRDEGASDNG